MAEVDILDELARRPVRPRDYEREHRAFERLSVEMAEHPTNVLQLLVEVALELCDAHTAGVSVLEGDVFRWEAVAGAFAAARGGTMPRDDSPSGVCLARDATQLLHLPDRCYPALCSDPRCVETLLVPFYSQGSAVGTVWIVSHTVDRRFDREDERLVRMLSRFASAGWQLIKASEAAVTAGRRKDAFLATLGHELRNPLNTIVSAATVLRACLPHDARAAHAVEVIERQTLHCARLVDDLLDVERVETGKLHLDRRTVDLRTIVAQGVEARRPQLDARQHQLTVDLGPQPTWVDGDPVRLAQVVSNLLDNAAKYTPERGHIAVAVVPHPDNVEMTVRDSGVGVPADQAEGIFEPFTQRAETSTSSAGGLGLGLALVRRLTELHGGTVSVASGGPGLGSCFTVRLPAQGR